MRIFVKGWNKTLSFWSTEIVFAFLNMWTVGIHHVWKNSRKTWYYFIDNLLNFLKNIVFNAYFWLCINMFFIKKSKDRIFIFK